MKKYTSQPKRITITCTRQEFGLINTSAENVGMSLAAYCRNQALNGKVVLAFPVIADIPAIQEAARSLKPIAEDLNEIARYYRAKGMLGDQKVQELNEAFCAILDIKSLLEKEAKRYQSDYSLSKIQKESQLS